MSEEGKRLQAEAVFMFVAWLTLRNKRITLGSGCDATPAADVAGEFCSFNNLPNPNMSTTQLKHPIENVMSLEDFMELYDES